MKQCEEIRGQINFYIDDELHAEERASLEAHLRSCRECGEAVERERAFVENVRQARPLYTATDSLRQEVEKILSRAPEPLLAPARLRLSIASYVKIKSSRYYLAAAAVIVIAAAVGLWFAMSPKPVERGAPSEFARMAVEAHGRHLAGHLPLEITTASADEISRWFAGKVPFSLTLPDYQGLSGQEKLYDLKGARLVAFNNDYAAYVAYNMRTRPISLVVTSESTARPRGGEEIVSKGLTFHYDSIDGLKVITWSDRGLTYALVSDLEERGQQSCMVCHAGTKDRDFIEELKPKGF
ncbi:MAG: zf-HC2 domain-containing protein [Acidobacteriota bacterium]